MKQQLRNLFAHPRVRGRDMDGPDSAALRRSILSEKAFLGKIYTEWYKTLASEIPSGTAPVLEIGSGGGFFSDRVPGLIPSDLTYGPWIKIVLNGMLLPFKPASLRSIVMTNVFHHFSEPRKFLSECRRCLMPGGTVAMLEPWASPWSRLVFTALHHEPFLPGRSRWEADPPGKAPNNALPWMVFQRDRKIFEAEFPGLQLASVRPAMPFRYLLAGGISMRSFAPAWSFQAWKSLEKLLTPLFPWCAMFAYVKLIKK